MSYDPKTGIDIDPAPACFEEPQHPLVTLLLVILFIVCCFMIPHSIRSCSNKAAQPRTITVQLTDEQFQKLIETMQHE
jgi:hypothetical protein